MSAKDDSVEGQIVLTVLISFIAVIVSYTMPTILCVLGD